jgi:site-specific DNA recombinase
MTTVQPTSIAATYERVSTRLQGQTGFSLGAQSKDAAQFAQDNQWELPEDLRFRDGEDRAASGADWDLPGLNAMLDAATQRRFSVLVVPTVDRFARDMGKALVLEQQLRKHGIRVVYINAPIDDSAEGRLLLRQLQSFAEFEREKIAFRTARGRREKIERGQILGNGPAPYGYRYLRIDQGNSARKRVVDLEIDPLTAPVVVRIFTLALRLSAEQIVDVMRKDGVPPPPGYNRRTPSLRWARDLIQRILTHPVYVGRMIYGGADGRRRAAMLSADGQSGVVVPAIVERELWDEVQQALLRRQTTRKGRSANDPWLLRGLLTCGHCGGALSIGWNRSGATAAERAEGKSSGQSYRQYRCLRAQRSLAVRAGTPVCELRAVRADHIEGAVWQGVHDLLMRPDALRMGVEAARAQFDAARTRHQERIDVADHEIARLVSQIERIVDELLETPKGAESYRALVERQRRVEDTLQRLRAERSNMDTESTQGISQAAVDELAEFSREVAAGLSVGSVAERRWALQMLRLQGKVSMDPNGIRFGRVNHRYAVDLDAVVHVDAIGAAGLSNTSQALSLAFQAGLFLRLAIVGRPERAAEGFAPRQLLAT